LSVTVVMPVYNEKEVIEAQVREYYQTIVSTILGSDMIVVDDASTDGTSEILDQLASELPLLSVVHHTSNLGHGRSIRDGYEAASGDWVFQVDSDGQFLPEDFQVLYEEKEGVQCVIGTRSVRRDRWYRLVLSSAVRRYIRMRFGLWIEDCNSPFRLMRRDFVVNSVRSMALDTLAPNIFLAVIAGNVGELREIEVRHVERKNGPGSLPPGRLLRFSWQALLQFSSFQPPSTV